MSMAATAGNPKAAGMGISCVSCARPLTHHQQYQTQSRAARRRAAPDETEGLSLLRKEAGRHLAASNWCKRGRKNTEEKRRTDDYILECPDRPIRLVNLIQSWDLYEPSNVMWKQLVVHDPFGKLVPFVRRSSVYANSPFHILIFALFQVRHQLWQNIKSSAENNYLNPHPSSTPPSTFPGYNYLSSKIFLLAVILRWGCTWDWIYQSGGRSLDARACRGYR